MPTDDLTPLLLCFAFLAGLAVRDALGLFCIKGHLLRIERHLGIDPYADSDGDEAGA